jgi:hypothetical protein
LKQPNLSKTFQSDIANLKLVISQKTECVMWNENGGELEDEWSCEKGKKKVKRGRGLKRGDKRRTEKGKKREFDDLHYGFELAH